MTCILFYIKCYSKQILTMGQSFVWTFAQIIIVRTERCIRCNRCGFKSWVQLQERVSLSIPSTESSGYFYRYMYESVLILKRYFVGKGTLGLLKKLSLITLTHVIVSRSIFIYIHILFSKLIKWGFFKPIYYLRRKKIIVMS